MVDFNIHFLIYDDLGMLETALEFIPSEISVYVCDGRYSDFDGDYDLTPGAEEFCAQRSNVRYSAPPDDRLPFGDPTLSEYRSSNHAKARWAYYDVLPQDEWTVHLDTDEWLIHFDTSVFDFEEDVCFCPQIYREVSLSTFERLTSTIQHRPSVFKPKYWSFWTDDGPVLRENLPRDITDVKEIRRRCLDANDRPLLRTESVLLYNVGRRRSESYRRRRAAQLEKFCEEEIAERVRRSL